MVCLLLSKQLPLECMDVLFELCLSEVVINEFSVVVQLLFLIVHALHTCLFSLFV